MLLESSSPRLKYMLGPILLLSRKPLKEDQSLAPWTMRRPSSTQRGIPSLRSAPSSHPPLLLIADNDVGWKQLLLQMIVRRFIPAMPGTTIISVNPGLCRSNLGRHRSSDWSLASLTTMVWYLTVSRTSEQGARNVTAAAVLAEDSHEVSASVAQVKEADSWWDDSSGHAVNLVRRLRLS